MNDLSLFKDIKKYSKYSLILTITVFALFIFQFVILPIIFIESTKQNIGYFNLFVFLASLIAIIVYNIIIIVRSCSLTESKDKTVLIIMSVLGLFLLGIVSNIVTLIISKENIKKLSEVQKDKL